MKKNIKIFVEKELIYQVDDTVHKDDTNINKNRDLPPDNKPKERTAEEEKEYKDKLTADVGSSIIKKDANVNITKADDVEISFKTCDSENKMNDDFGKELFTLYERAKKILNSNLLPLIGCYQLNKINLLTTTKGKGSQEEMLELVEQGLFVQLTEKEYTDINVQINLWKKQNPTLKIAWDKIIERDNKYKKNWS